MLKRLIALLFALMLTASLATAPAEAEPPRGGIYERGSYNDPYKFRDKDCDFPFVVKGRAKGHFITYNVRGSDGQAFLAHNWYHFREVLTNPANDKKMFVSGTGYFREVDARHVRRNVWEFTAIDEGTPFVVRDASGRIVLMDSGKLITTSLFNTLGDRQPGAEFIRETSVRKVGSFPSMEPDFDFCALVSRLIGNRS